MANHPPNLALRLFRWYCSEERLEELEGDLQEQFEIDLELKRPFPKLRFWWNVIRCARSYAISRRKKQSENHFAMSKTNFLLFLRNFKKNALYGTLNVFGLSLAFAALGLIAIYIHYEMSFENFHDKADRIYRVSYKTTSAKGETHWARVPVDYVNQLPDEVNGIKTLIRFQNHEEKNFKIGTRKFKEDYVYQTDADVFDVFSFDFLTGNSASALASPRSIVISESLATKYFGEKSALDKEIMIAGNWSDPMSFKVTGVFRDLPSNTHHPINALMSFASPEQRSWWSYTYILLEDENMLESVQGALAAFVERHSTNEIQEESFVLQQLQDIHLRSNLAREIAPNGSWQNVKIFAVIALLIIIVALVNFTNISSVIFLSRLKEIGVRKVLGSHTRQLSTSIIMETLMYSLLAVMLGGVIMVISYPYFSKFTDASFLLNPFAFAGMLISIAIMVGLIAGVYPASLSRKIQSVRLLKKDLPSINILGNTSFGVKKGMLTVQFAIAALLILCAFIASDQFRFMQSQNLKMQPEQVLALPGIPNSIKDQYLVFKERLSRVPGAQSMSVCMQVPSSEIRDAGFFRVAGIHNSKEEAPIFDVQVVGHDFFEVMRIDLLAGEFFPDYIKPTVCPELTEAYTHVDYLQEQKRAYLINETASRALGFDDPLDAIGKQASFELLTKLQDGPIVGVIEDYHQASLKNEIDPTIYVYEPLWLGTMLIRMQTEEAVSTLESIEGIWDELAPNFKLQYEFLDELYNQQYKSERKQLDLLFLFSVLAIIIAFLGIFGLIAYVLKTKLKELAIRKVLGANRGSLVTLVGRQYFLLLSVGLVVAIPAAILAMDSWLQNFVYHIDISPLSFFYAFALMMFLLGITIAFQTLRTASLNPVDSLKDD